jgi:DNA ligase-1
MRLLLSVFFLLSFCQASITLAEHSTQSSFSPPRLAHAQRYHESVDISQYLVSEKLDGVRGYWDGHKLMTRTGNVIHAPASFTKNWPNAKLDGELWLGRGQFEKLSGIVRRKVPLADDWVDVGFMLFDLHPQLSEINLPFQQRLKKLSALVGQANNRHLQVVPQSSISHKQDLNRRLQEVVKQGGEGLILHRIDAPYRVGRSQDILKLKPHLDAEARVIGHKPGAGKYLGMLGSLKVEGMNDSISNGKIFHVGTGFTDDDRSNPPPIGSIITYRFQGYTNSGLPRFSRFLRVSKKH